MTALVRECRLCVVDGYEVDERGECAGCQGSKVENVTHCDGCDEHADDAGPLARYLVTHHDGGESDAYYCADCRDLAAADWNGETAAIIPFPTERT